MAEQIKDLDNLKPIDHAVPAKPHTAVYKMHRYFARRPWSVFRGLVEHYSNPGSIILDPFCGGGVTVIEGLRLGRKVIGVDLNPLATFITRLEALDVDLAALREAFDHVEDRCRAQIEEMYLALCPNCGQSVPADWFEWSKCHMTPKGKRAVLAECRKIKPGEYELGRGRAKEQFKPLECEQLPDVLMAVHVECPHCSQKTTKRPDEQDATQARRFSDEYDIIVKQEGLPIPPEAIPDGNMARENALFKRGITHFEHLFTRRNLIANGRLKKAILQAGFQKEVFDFIGLALSGSLRYSNSMVFRNEAWRGDKPLEWAKPAYWIPDSSLEANVWRYFSRRWKPIHAGKKYTKSEIDPPARHVTPKAVLGQRQVKGSLFSVLTGSADSLPLPDESVDAIITDPPYGGNVQYAELCDFWVVWLHQWLGTKDVIDNRKEAITTRHRGFASAKDIHHYRLMLRDIFRECYRVLKPGRWMVMTFHNKEFKVWNALHMTAHDAGFVLAEHDGMIYQPPIKLYAHTINLRRSGSMLGDFILSFQKTAKPPKFKQVEHAEIGRHIERLAAEAVLHHRGASLSTIYMKLMPWLLNSNLLDKITEKELAPYLQANFEEREGVWDLKDEPDRALRQDLERYSKQHYKASYDELDFVPIQARIEYLIRRLLYGRGYATQDDVLNQIYTNLINSNMAEVREIQRVLESLADLVPLAEAVAGRVPKSKRGRKVWKLKEDIERERLWREMGADVEYRLASSEESDHDLAIARLVEIAGLRKLKAHIGRTEQTKYTEFRRMSSPLPKRIQGLPKAARRIIEQIDVLWHNGGRGVVAAFEVERTSTITSGIDRFRNLLAVVPEPQMQLYIVVPKARGDEVRRKIGSPANRKAGLHRRIGYVYLQDLQIRSRDPSVVKFEKITHYVGDK